MTFKVDGAGNPNAEVHLGDAKTMGQGTATTSKEIVFVLSPFRSPFDEYYNKITRPAIEDAGFTALRADEIFGTRYVITDIWQSIQKAQIVVAEMTGKNANVLYEVGLCHAIGKPVVMMTQTMDDIPFDLKARRCIVYSTTAPGWDAELKGKICQTLVAVAPQGYDSVFPRPITTNFSLLLLNDAIRACTPAEGRVDEMRILALTSGIIQPIIEGCKFKIGTCYILLPRFANVPERGRRK
jgi:hypothetical protein